MIGNNLELSIIDLFSGDLTAGFTILQISKLLKKAYPYINKKANEFIEEEIFLKTKVGNSHLCHLNLESPQTIILLTLIELRKLEARMASEPQTEALISELKSAREEFNMTLVAEFGNEIFVICEQKNPELIKKYPLLASRKTTQTSSREFQSKLARETATQIFFGFEQYYFLFSLARGKMIS